MTLFYSYSRCSSPELSDRGASTRPLSFEGAFLFRPILGWHLFTEIRDEISSVDYKVGFVLPPWSAYEASSRLTLMGQGLQQKNKEIIFETSLYSSVQFLIHKS